MGNNIIYPAKKLILIRVRHIGNSVVSKESHKFFYGRNNNNRKKVMKIKLKEHEIMNKPCLVFL